MPLGEEYGQGQADDVALALDHRFDRLADPVRGDNKIIELW
ncbi:hypothetical protein [Streptosporangium vulgare]